MTGFRPAAWLTMDDVPIPFGEWRPDQAPHMSPMLAEATNVLPVAGAYAPFPAHATIAGTTVSLPAKGFFATPMSDGSPLIYGATENQVFRILNGSTANAYNGGLVEASRWWFAQLGGTILAGCDVLPPVGGLPGATFVPLGGSPPTAKVGAIVERSFLVLGDLIDDGIDGRKPSRVRWSGFNNPNTWGTNVGTQADFEDMIDEGGPVVQITGRSTGTVFQRNAITRMQFVGGSTVFNFTTVEKGRGPISSGAVCDIGPLVFYIADDGFFAWDGTQSVPIGTGRVDRWFAENVNVNRLSLISSGFDPRTRCVLWAFPEVGQPTNTAIIAYSLADQRFTLIRVSMQQIGASATLPATLDSMPIPDAAVLSWDDPIYAGQSPILAGISDTNTYGTFSGPYLSATLTTGDFQSAPGKRSFVTGVRPLIDCATATVAVGEREQDSNDAVVFNTATALGVDGVCPARFDGRYIRYKVQTPNEAVWTRATGIEVGLRATGRR